ncbi:putative Transposon Tf2-6 polyprotein [Pseudoloma neurophilia]|uniref:Putative Transposon Tf2-6 polyprotein n=1 Tax=Pseudoloma neurophilia TaxID=146866 RepID=A0A0R0M2V7_9MICR|nr:putative Transposon Tf2-6 polyprotein [Pseudoloma neurophilia]
MRGFNTLVDITIKDTKLTALCDSGSNYTLLNSKLAEQLKLEKSPNQQNLPTILTANTGQCSIIGRAFCKIQMSQKTDLTINIEVYLIDNLAYQLILGRDFLERHGFILNFRDGIIHTDYGPIEMKAATEIDSFDQATDNKLLRNLSCTLTSEQTFVQEFLKSLAFSSTLGLIPNIKHIIETKDNIPITCKPYAVPFALREATRAEIERQKTLGIIRHCENGWGSPAFPKQKKMEKFAF